MIETTSLPARALIGTVSGQKEPMPKTLRNPSQEKEFLEKGYFITPCFTREQVDEIVKALANLKPADGFKPEKKDNNLPFASYHCTFLDANIDYKRRTFELLDSLFAKFIDTTFYDYRILAANFYVKPSGTGRFEMHQNWAVLNDLQHTSFTLWCPLQDTTKENGTLHVVEGSHRMLSFLPTTNCYSYFHKFEDAILEKYLTPLDVKAGDCVVFCDSLIHWSPENSSPQPRIAIQICIIPKSCTPVHFHYERSDATKDVEVFNIDKDFYIERSIGDLFSRPSMYKSLGFVQNPNTEVSEEEFLDMLKHGNEIREVFYTGQRRLNPR